eukprot:scaffold1051_cov119-Cylindrotheca_fusiformis.AAC.16
METEAENAPLYFLYTSETRGTDIPRTTLTRLRVDSSATEIHFRAFFRCEGLVRVLLPETLTRIKESAFQCCVNLKCVQFVSEDSLENSSSFDHSLEEGLVVPEQARLHIEPRAFSYCNSLRKVTVCSVSPTIGWGNFRCCSGLTFVQLPEGLLAIERELFYQCTSLSSVKIPSSVIKIESAAFFGCGSLSFVDFPPGLRRIEGLSFSLCQSIETLHIPSTVSTILYKAFSACERLTYVKLPQTLETVGKLVFEKCPKLEHVGLDYPELPPVMAILGYSMFKECRRLQYMKLPPTLEIIETSLFEECHRLEYIEIPSTVKKIREGAFQGCSSLTHVRIPPSVEHIERRVFAFCKSLVSIELPEGLLLDSDRGDSGDRDYWDLDHGIALCPSLLNVAFPTLTVTDYYTDFEWRRLKLFSVADGRWDLLVKLKHRFDKSPLNKLCYYQSYYSLGDAMAKLRSLMGEDLLAASQVDEFGMTPLHILSLSQNPNLSMMVAVIGGGHPDHIIHGRDSFRCTPMHYLCLNSSPSSTQVIRSLLQMRLDRLGLDRWKSELSQAVDKALAVERSSRSREIGVVCFKCAQYERMEVLSLVELCLWKLKIDEVDSIEQSADRLSCRINSGASIVIPPVLAFLGKLDVEDYLLSSEDQEGSLT